MIAYSIEVNNGKIIGDSTFFRIANDLLHKEFKVTVLRKFSKLQENTGRQVNKIKIKRH